MNSAVQELTPMLEEAYPDLPNTRWIAMRLLDGDYRVRQALEKGDFSRMQSTHLPIATAQGLEIETTTP